MVLPSYAKWMYAWETSLSSRDTNRVVRSLDWGFDWLPAWSEPMQRDASEMTRLIALSASFAANSDEFYGYQTPTDFRLEKRHPQLFPTNSRPETLEEDDRYKRRAATGLLPSAEFLRFTSASRTPYPENDQVNARWYPAVGRRRHERYGDDGSRQALIVLPQWNADAFSHNALCEIFNRFGISCLRLSKPYHDIRRPSELHRSDYAVSANVGRTIAACQQAVRDIRACVDWLEAQGYKQFGILGTSLGSSYAFIAAAHDARLQVCAFNHASTWFGDVVWTGQSTHHIRVAFQEAGLSQSDLREIFRVISPMAYLDRFASPEMRQVLVVHAKYDLTFLEQFSLDLIMNFRRAGVKYQSRVLPCGHYVTGETPYKFLDAWHLGSFIHKAFKRLRLKV